jgi:tetratricopeptide (TPR) repeat protein
MSVLLFRPTELTAAELFARAAQIDDDDPNEGMRLYRRVIHLDPNHDLAMSNLGKLYFAQKEYGAAETWWRYALKANPKQPEAHYNLGYLCAMRGTEDVAKQRCAPERSYAYKLAIDFFCAALVLDEGFADAHFNLADTLEKLGEYEEARAHWRRYVQIGGPFVKQAMAALGMRVVE